jgi:hypothetical protein
MDKPTKKIRVVGERRPQLDTKRFADALIAFALHCMSERDTPTETPGTPAETDQEAS